MLLVRVQIMLLSFISVISSPQNADMVFERYWVVSTKLSALPRVKCSPKRCEALHLNLENFASFDICVYRGDLREFEIFNEFSKLIVYEEDGSKNETLLQEMDYTTLRGYVVGHRNDSNVDGYLYQDRFLGKIYINDTVLYVEDLADYARALKLHKNKRKSIIYENTISSVNCSVKLVSNSTLNHKKRHLEQYYIRRGSSGARNIEGKVCTLGVYVDTAYYKYSMGKDEKKTRTSIIESVKTANTIFRSTDFMNIGRPNNLGFVIKDLVIYKESHKSPLPPFYPFLRDGVRQMKNFAGNVHLLENVTLGVLFTGQKLTDNAMGWAFMPSMSGYEEINPHRTLNGICSITPDGKYSGNNALLVITEGYTKRASQELLDLVLSHELGHAFGAVHDDESSHVMCQGYLMSSNTNTWAKGKKHTFSSCSREDISFVLEDRHFCMRRPAHRSAFCGNGIVEAPEQCDCGSKYACAESIRCCKDCKKC